MTVLACPAAPCAPAATPCPAANAALRAYVKLLRAHRAVLARVEPFLAASGLTPTQFGVLEALLHKGSLTQRELGRTVLTSAGNMTDVIDKLEARGLLVRCRSANDRRSVQVGLTACGRAMISDLYPRHAQDVAGAMAGLSPAELDQLGALLCRLGASLQE